MHRLIIMYRMYNICMLLDLRKQIYLLIKFKFSNILTQVLYCAEQEEMERLKAAISKLQSGEGEEDSEEKVQLLT